MINRLNPFWIFILSMIIALVFGYIVNSFLHYEARLTLDGSIFIVLIFAALSIVSGTLAFIVSRMLGKYRHRHLAFVVVSVVALCVSLLVFPPAQYNGIHIFVIVCFGLLIASVVNFTTRLDSRL